MDKAISTALFIVVSMIMAIMLFNVAYPALVEGGDAINAMSARANEQLRSQIAVIHATGEWNDGTPQDLDGDGDIEVYIWVKNVGDTRITALKQLDVFFGKEGDFRRIGHASEGTGGAYWDATIANASEWSPTATLMITVHNASLQAGRQFVKVVAPSGASSDYYWSL